MKHGSEADLELAKRAAREAGAVVMRYFGGQLEVRHKSPGQPLTEADLAADALLRERLIGARPEDGWLSEETLDTADRLGRARVWIVDPIDGTRSFIAGRAEFAISVALAVDGRPVIGVVCNPARDEMFFTRVGGGAFVEDADGVHPLHASTRGEQDDLLMLASRSEIGRGEFDPFRDDWRIEPAGSTAYKLAWIAAGRGDAFVSRGPKSEWDIAAGVLLVDEAGGRVTDVLGDVPAFNRPDPYVHGIVATNGVLHDELLGRIAALPPTRRMRSAERSTLHGGFEREGES